MTVENPKSRIDEADLLDPSQGDEIGGGSEPSNQEATMGEDRRTPFLVRAFRRGLMAPKLNPSKEADGKMSGDAPGAEDAVTTAGNRNGNAADIPVRSNLAMSEDHRPMQFQCSPGTRVADRYTIRRGIGVGGFGEVYFAISEGGKEVALKQIQRNWEVELRGARHCLNLKHPNLVSLHDVAQDENEQWWIVMEYIAGPSLRRVLDDHPAGLDDQTLDRWFEQICKGVAHLHTSGLVHRDLKPGNIFDDAGVVKVGDYGLSKFISSSHRGGHTESVGTFHYMAPEVGRGQYGPGVDVYALGVVLYEMLTGKVPFDGESCHEIIVKHMTANPDFDIIDPKYRAVVQQCLEKDPDRRYADGGELLAAWRSARSGQAVLPNSPQMNAAQLNAAQMNPAQMNPAQMNPAQMNPSQPNGGYPIGSVPNPPFPIHSRSANPQPANTFGQQGQVHPDHPPQKPQHHAVPGGYPNSSSPQNEEPIARAVKGSLSDLTHWWQSMDATSRTALLIVGIIVGVMNTHWIIPVLSVIAVLYLPYYVIRQVVVNAKSRPVYANRQRHAMASLAAKPLTRTEWRSSMRHDMQSKNWISRASEWNTSIIASSIAVPVIAALVAIFVNRNEPVESLAYAPYFWVAVVVWLGSVGLLGLGKFWEKEEGDGGMRRIAAGALGAGVGAGAGLLHRFLLLPGDEGLYRDIFENPGPGPVLQSIYANDGGAFSVTPAAMMIYFAILFAGIRWWKPVDPLRRRRISLWSILVPVVGAWFVHQFIPVPQPLGMMAAGGIAIVSQLAAPWVHPQTPPSVILREPVA